MSDLFGDLVEKAKQALDPVVDRAKQALDPVVDKTREVMESGELQEKAGEVLEGVREKVEELKDAATSGELQEKAEGLMEKAAPVLERVKDAAEGVIERVKGGVTEAVTGQKPDLKNDLFDHLGEEAAETKQAVADQAEALQEKIEEMLGGGDEKKE